MKYIEQPLTIDIVMNRVGAAKEDHEIALFMKANRDLYCIFSDTYIGRQLVKFPRYGSKLVGLFHSKHDEFAVRAKIVETYNEHYKK